MYQAFSKVVMLMIEVGYNREYYYNYLFKLVDSKYYDDVGDYPRELSDELPEPCLEPPTIENLKESILVNI